jgi:type VI secretion system protein ImpJ
MQPVLWTKGVLLSPQHFQTQDRFLEDLLEFQLSALAFCPWGFQRLAIDREALASGSFALAEAAGILPDGLLFDMPSSEDVPPPRPLEGAFAQDQEWLDVYLTIPEYRYGGHNVSGINRDRDARYRADELLRRDEITGQSERPIQVARRNFRIMFAGESLDGTSALRIARVTRSPAGDYLLDSRFVPPLVDIVASDHLMAIARRLIEILSAKSTTLSAGRRQKNQSLAEFGVADVATFWLLYSINSALPELRHIYETRRGHPVELFNSMLGLAGALTTFSGTVQARALPTYEHDNLSASFTRLDEMLRDLLESVVPATTAVLPMKLVQPSVYAAALDQDKYLVAPQVYLAITVEGRSTDVPGRAPSLVKVATPGQLETLIRQALPGIALTHVPNPPSAVSVKVNYNYFLLQRSGPEWENVLRSRSIAAYVPAEFNSPSLELVIVLPKA